MKDSDRMKALLDRNPLAEALYWRIKAMADDFGRYLGDPADVGAGVCPRNLIGGNIKLKKVEEALADMEACNVISIYTGPDGKRYLEIVDYLSHAHDQWSSVGKPEYPAPPGWMPPESLVQFLCQHANAQNVSAGRFGVSIECWPGDIEYPFDTHLKGIRRVSNTPPIDSDLDSDSEGDKEGDEDAPAGAPEVPPAPPSPNWQVPDDYAMQVGIIPATCASLSEACPRWSRVDKMRWLYAAANSFASPAGRQAGLTDEALAAEIGANIPANSSRGDWYTDKLIEKTRKAQSRASPPPGAPLPHGQHGSGVLTL